MKRLAALVVLVLLPSIANAQAPFEGFDLRPPCEGVAPPPAYGPVGAPPAIAVWTESTLNRAAWQAAPCLRWAGGKVRMASALAATLASGSLDDLLSRFGALSQYRSIRYWSIMHESWQELVTSAGFLDGPQARYSHPDLKPVDFVSGREFFYYEIGAGGRTIHRLSVHQRTSERMEVTTENVSAIQYAMFTVFEPGSLQTVTFFDRRGPNQWAYFQTIGIGQNSNFLAVQSASPYINRLTALYRYMAGVPTDRDPPVAPR